MILPDINFLIYAYREDTTKHKIALKELEQIAKKNIPLVLSSVITTGFIRITTNPRIYSKPSSLSKAFQFINFLTTFPNFRWIEASDNHWNLFKELTKESGLSGSKLTDVLIASIAKENGCEIITFDKDFKRFDNLNIKIL
jgi:hypothetical protein